MLRFFFMAVLKLPLARGDLELFPTFVSDVLAQPILQRALDGMTNDGMPHDNLGPQLNFTIWLMTMLAFGFILLRLYYKFIRNRSFWWDDYILCASWVC